ncbi:hypothetical protein ACU6C7_006116 [Pseudomonas aeruginosa]|nr:hypothetical protein [Pseudomonas aeruginosa]
MRDDHRDAHTAAIAATLPKDRDELCEVAIAALDAIHTAVVEGDRAAALTAYDRYDAAVWKLNGCTFFGVNADDGVGTMVRQRCAPEPGQVPQWEQRGEFAIEVGGLRAVVRPDSGFGRLRAGLGFYAVDAGKPFMSPTGFRHHFIEMPLGKTVEQAAREVFAQFMATARCWISPEHAANISAARWPWLDVDADELVDDQVMTYEEDNGQIGFVF